MNFKHFIQIFLLLVLTISIDSCGSDSDDKNIPDISNINAPLNLIRFEKEVFAADTNNIVAAMQNLSAKYPALFEQFLAQIISIKGQDFSPAETQNLFRMFLTDQMVRKTYDTTALVFNNFGKYEKELQEGVKFYKYYFPNNTTPTFATFFSMYNYDAFLFGKDTIGIGLDFFLGSQHQDYAQLETTKPMYIRRTLTPEHLAAKTFRMLTYQLAGEPQGNRLLDYMIHNGKQLYILDCLLPNTPDSIKFGYTAIQTQWCKDEEAGMWASLLKENVLYETNSKKIIKLISPSPNSPGMPPEAPGETANFLGWQIVKQYMKRNPNMSLSELISVRDAQKILDGSKYKPRQKK